MRGFSRELTAKWRRRQRRW